MTFYAYTHARPDGTAFYVGKGAGNRLRPLPARNRHHGFVLAKHGAENILVKRYDCVDEASAFRMERRLIKMIRAAGVKLTNVTDGGEGSSGYRHTQEAKDKIAASSRKLAQDPEIQARRRIASTAANNERWADSEYRAATSSAMRGVKKSKSDVADDARRANALKASTPEANAKKATASKAMWADPIFREKMSAKRRVAWGNPVKRAAMLAGRSEGIKKSWLDPEVKAKRINGIKRAYSLNKEN